MRDSISVVISAYNEGESVNELHKELTKVMKDLPLKSYELIFVDDGSSDDIHWSGLPFPSPVHESEK